MNKTGIIYIIKCKDKSIKDCYIGSTTNLKNRIMHQKYCCNNPNSNRGHLKLYQFMRDNGGFINFEHKILEDEIEFNNRKELNKIERYYIEEFKSSLNIDIPSRTVKEYRKENREKIKEYYKIRNQTEKRKEYSKMYNKQYREKNKDKNMISKNYLDIKKENNFLGDFRAMPAQVGDIAGIKWVSVFPENKSWPTVIGTILLNSAENGKLLAVLDGTYITKVRTAAAAAVATEKLANKDSEVASFVGCGGQTMLHVEAIDYVMPNLSRFVFYDKNK